MDVEELWRKQKERICRSAATLIEAGDEPRFVILGQTRLPYWLVPLPFSALYGARKRCVLISDRNVYIFAMPMFSPNSVSALIDKHPLTMNSLTRGSLGSLTLAGLKLFPISAATHRREANNAIQFVSKLTSAPGN